MQNKQKLLGKHIQGPLAQDPQHLPETMDSTECIFYVFSYTYIPMCVLGAQSCLTLCNPTGL